MFTKTKIALAATLFAATSTVAMAQGFDPNLANRYPHQGRNVGVTNEQSSSWGQTEIDIDRADRASSPYAGGGY
jgi:hypothetical protein